MPSAADPLDVAVELLHRDGSASRVVGVTVRVAASLAAVHRSTVYRAWETVDDLNDDLAVHLATQCRGWSALLVEDHAQGSLATAVDRALRGAPNDLGLWARSAVAGWPASSPARATVVAEERAWLDRFGRWLERLAAARGRRWADDATRELGAVALAALVDGAVLDAALWRADGLVAIEDRRVAGVARSAERLWDSLTVADAGARQAVDRRSRPPSTGEGEPLGRPDVAPDDTVGHRVAILEAIRVAIADRSPETSGITSAARLVPARRLARSLAVSERRLVGLWPSAASFNADLIARLLADRQHHREQDVVAALLAGPGEGEHGVSDLVLRAMTEAVLDATSARGHAHESAAAALADPLVRQHVREQRAIWRNAQRTSSTALLGMIGWTRRPGVDVATFGDISWEWTHGAQRWAALHPDLCEATVTFEGRDLPLLGLAGWHLIRSLVASDPAGHPRARDIH